MGLVAVKNIGIGGFSFRRTVRGKKEANQFGRHTITMGVKDGTATAKSSFVLTVIPVNDAPSISQIPDQTINEDTVLGPIPFIIGDVETSAENLVVSGTSDNPLLVPESHIFLSGSDSNRALVIAPATNQFGSATITI